MKNIGTREQKRRNKNSFIALNLFIFILSVYLLTASGPLFFSDYDAWQLRLDVVESIVERVDISISDELGIMGSDGRAYSLDSIGSALLSIPFYISAKIIGVQPEIAVSMMNLLFGAGTVVIIFLFGMSLAYSTRTSLAIAIFYGLGTLAWPLSKQPFDHTIETFFILLSVYSMYLYGLNKKISHLMLSALFLGVSFITRPTSVFIIVPLLILGAISYAKKYPFKESYRLIVKDILFFSIVLLPFLCIFFWHNYFRFGSIFETGYVLKADRLGVDFFAGTPLLTGLRGFLISPGKGFFYYSPITILFFFSIKSFMKQNKELGVSFVFIIIVYLLFFSKNIFWHGDWAWGPRYLLVITPFFIIPIGQLLDSHLRSKKRIIRILVYSIFIASIIIQITAVSVDYRKYFLNLLHEEKETFTIIQGDGVQSLIVPPTEIYFDWGKSPLLAQFVFVHTITRNIKDYEYGELPEDASLVEQTRKSLYTNVFDFWWVYKYYLDKSYAGFIGALFLLCIMIFAAIRLKGLSDDR